MDKLMIPKSDNHIGSSGHTGMGGIVPE